MSRQSATRWFHDGVLAVPARPLATGTILAGEPRQCGTGVAICARVSSSDQRAGLGRQLARIAERLTAGGTAPAKVVSEVGCGLNGRRTRHLEAALAAQGLKLVVIEQAEVSDDPVRDMVEVLASFCARLYGRSSAKHRAELALAAASTNQAA